MNMCGSFAPTLTNGATQHISFTTTKLGSLLDVEDSSDPEGLRVFYYLIQVRRCAFFPARTRARIHTYRCLTVRVWTRAGSQVFCFRYVPDALQGQAPWMKPI